MDAELQPNFNQSHQSSFNVKRNLKILKKYLHKLNTEIFYNLNAIMTEPTPKPKYIYKILPPSTPPSSPLPEILPVSELDERDGFLHMSTSHQVLGTLRNFFSNETHVWLLRVPYERVTYKPDLPIRNTLTMQWQVSKLVKWEDAIGKQPDEKGGCWDVEGKSGYFPHIHQNGMRLGKEEVESVGKWERGEQWNATCWPFDEDIPTSPTDANSWLAGRHRDEIPDYLAN